MDFNLKTYKYLKIRYYFKTVNFFLFFQGTSLNNKNWIKIEQNLYIHKLKYFRIFNKLMINVLINSVFKNVNTLINGPILILNNKDSKTKLTFTELENISSFIHFLGFKLNNKIYSKNQIKNLKKISYVKNFYLFHNSINIFAKTPFYTLKKNKNSVSK